MLKLSGRRWIWWGLFLVSLLLYLILVGYFAFRPFVPIRGVYNGDRNVLFEDGAVWIQRGTAWEERGHAKQLRGVLLDSGRLSLVVVLKTDPSSARHHGLIFADIRDGMALNYAIRQNGNGISFQLRTSESRYGGMPEELLVPRVLQPDQWQVLITTYDGAAMRLYVDGRLRGESMVAGDFSGWGLDNALVMGDVPAGYMPWRGFVRQVSVYNRALGADDVARIQNGDGVAGAVLDHDFRTLDSEDAMKDAGWVGLLYRNPFVFRDSEFSSRHDIVANIVGFIPLGVFVFLGIPVRQGRRGFLLSIALAAAAGLLVSGSIECLQHFVHSRVPSVIDLATNLCGTLLGCGSAWSARYVFRIWTRTATL